MALTPPSSLPEMPRAPSLPAVAPLTPARESSGPGWATSSFRFVATCGVFEESAVTWPWKAPLPPMPGMSRVRS